MLPDWVKMTNCNCNSRFCHLDPLKNKWLMEFWNWIESKLKAVTNQLYSHINIYFFMFWRFQNVIIYNFIGSNKNISKMCCDRKLTKNRRETRSDILQRQALFRGVKQLLTRSGNKKKTKRKKRKEKKNRKKWKKWQMKIMTNEKNDKWK